MSNRIKPVFKCPEPYKETFKSSSCLLTISVGQEVHEEEKFASTIELINSSFKSCVMLIDDTLQRHSMVLDCKESPESFYKVALEEGDAWLERNKKYYDKLSILENIIRWDQWLQHKDYPLHRAKIKILISQDSNYKAAFKTTISEFLRRYRQRITNHEFNEIRAHRLCLDYLIEECTAMCLWPELNCNFEVYPSQRNPAMSETYKRFVLPSYPNLLQPVAIKFKNRDQLQSQHFKLMKNNENIAPLKRKRAIG